MKKQKPQYEHDCKSCNFLGRFSFEDDDYDLYFCVKSRITVIARYGDCSTTPGGGYLSGLENAEYEPALFEAKQRLAKWYHMFRKWYILELIEIMYHQEFSRNLRNKF